MSAAVPSVEGPRRACTPRESRKRTARAVAVGVALAAAAVAATWDAWVAIVRRATLDDEQSHVLLVPIVVLWLVWVRRERLRGYVPEATWAGPVLIAAGWGLHRLGDTYLIESAWHLGAVVAAAGAFLAATGGGLLARLLPAFGALCFLVPVPGVVRHGIALPLQTATAECTRVVLETFGVAVDRSGNMLRVNDHEVMIAEACNGLRMAFALLLVSYTFAWGGPLRNGVRVAVVLATPITAIAFNVVRLVPVVWSFGALPASVADAIHAASGWTMLPFAYLALMGLMRLLRWAQVPVTPYAHAHAHG